MQSRAGIRPCAATLLVVALAGSGFGAEKSPAAAKVVGDSGILLQQTAPGKPWEVLKTNEAISPGALVIGAGGSIESANGSVGVQFFTSFSWSSTHAVMEGGITLAAPGDADIALTVDRGRVDLINLKKEGAARVRLTGRLGKIDLTLKEPGTRVILERFGRYPAGTRFRANKPSTAESGPMFDRHLAVAKGSASIAHDGKTIELAAPPGPAMIEADDLIGGGKPEILTLEKLPDYMTAQPKDPQKAQATLAAVRKQLETKSVREAGVALTKSNDEAERRAGLVILAAIDDMAGLGEVFASSKHPDLTEYGVLVLRNWLGRGPGQDAKLYAGLVGLKSYSPAEAETVINFLHGFSKEDLAQPETYQALIDYLDHPMLALRVMSHWHLVRVVPEGRSIAFQPHAEKEARDKTYKEWRKLLPEGTLPQNLKNTPEKK